MAKMNELISTKSGNEFYISEVSNVSFTERMVENFNDLQQLCHGVAVESGWWADPETGHNLDRNDGELICLMHSELSEAMEGLRKDLMDDHLPDRKSCEVELADCIIRILDFAEAKGYNIGDAIVDKLDYNTTRADHKPENRAKEGGKSF